PRAVQPAQTVADLPPGILDRARQAVEGPRAAEREQVRPRLRDAQGLDPKRLAGYTVVPLLAHKREAIWRIGHDGAHAGSLHPGHRFKAVAVSHFPRHAASGSSPSETAISPRR